ncbi:MAG TPA: response regulator [Puia sp.]|jgi:CheY-like chemotaxis protein|nr:response regulator [Puia sp.]
MTSGEPYILVADDDPEDQEMLAEQFRRSDPDVRFRWMANGYEVLDYLRTCPTEDLPRLMVIDYKMPGITGAEVLQCIQHEERLRHIPKVIWSTSNNQEYIKEALNSGADDYFAKPVDMLSFDKLVGKLTQLFRAGKSNGDNDPD